MMESCFDLMKTNNVMVVEVSPNCTYRLQPLDLSINKPVKDFLKRKFQSWYADNIAQQLKDSKAIKPVDLQLALMKLLSTKWIIEAVADIGQRKEVVINGFHHADIFDALKDVL